MAYGPAPRATQQSSHEKIRSPASRVDAAATSGEALPDLARRARVPSMSTPGSATVAVVVGGGSGIGAAVAERQRAAGATVLVWDVAGAADVPCDVSDPQQVDAATRATLARAGTPTVVTVTAGIGHSGLLRDVSGDDFDRVFAVNTKGPWLVMRALAAPMAAAGGGSIVVTSSVSARLVDRAMGLYCASKAALDMLVRVAAAEWGPALRVNAIAPGVTDTPMLGRAPRDGSWLSGVAGRTALARLGTADEVAEAIVALHAMRWVTGQVLAADGGLSLHSPIDAFGVPRAR
jgi:NAD(P)-dependent dehydrogenase (short-subunit alcohol dehydrogenase family)